MCASHLYGEPRETAKYPVMHEAALHPGGSQPWTSAVRRLGISTRKPRTLTWQIPGRPSRLQNRPEPSLPCD